MQNIDGNILKLLAINPMIQCDEVGVLAQLKEFCEYKVYGIFNSNFRLVLGATDDRLILVYDNETIATSKNSIDFNNIPNKIILKKEYNEED